MTAVDVKVDVRRSKYSGGQTIVCRTCGKGFIPRVRDPHCSDCRRVRKREYKARRLAAGLEAYYRGPYDARKHALRMARQARPEERIKVLARAKLVDAVNTGKVVRQPCKVCGVSPAHGHHTDYTKPLDVVWLCNLHHQQEHRRLREEARALLKQE